ncbi:PSD1 and planctomycete cytochrome C domain-containing protein [Chitinophaga sp. YIM B06452]|uniref:PSD1 and planctomycete cytochrome C domain-containing protein n=1 Tax=Chitinophaga sp. YIM B06452 TaxID=3082158 RepID=UPI0031FEC012
MKRNHIVAIAAVGLLFFRACTSSPGPQNAAAGKLPDEVDYNFHIRPILSDKCFTCHGPDANKREAGLRLDIGDSAFKALRETPGAFAFIPGKPHESEVYRRLVTEDTSLRMPPPNSNLQLTQYEIKLIEKWIKQGAKYKPHWAFVPPKAVKPPAVEEDEWPRNDIDRFVLEGMERNGLKPNPEADRERLLKRACLDITGLPPSIEMMDRFLADTRPDAFEHWVDTLLAMPQYGEKMAVHWMDVARYADSHGYQDDNYRSQWPWRDWVIHAFNTNLPYNTFVTWQLAGDLLPNSTREQLLASGFNRNHKITEEGGVIDEEYRVEYVRDRTNTLGKAFLGVTIECAQCHDHKYDPFSQKEYYQLSAFFNNVREVGLESSVGGPETYAKTPYMEISNAEVKDVLSFINRTDTNRLIVSVMGDLDTVRTTYILNRGVYDAHGPEVTAGTPRSIMNFSGQPNRLGLAQWLFTRQNPLTARVFVNRMWQEVFGKGIVKTSGDFGMQGELPSHPALLDWLAVDFMDHGWDIKRLMKQMITSATYRQSAVVPKEKLQVDPDNIWLSRAPRFRLPAEGVRDLVLGSSGLLVKKIGGPSVKPYQPKGLWELATSGRGILATYKQDHGESLYRRGLYTFIKRTVPPPSLMIFDGSNRDQCEVKRLTTNTPLQALVMLNDPQVLEASRVLAAKLLHEKKEPVETAFRMIVCRKPQEKELAILQEYYKDQQAHFRSQPGMADKVIRAGEYPLPDKKEIPEVAALMQVITAIYNLEESTSKS